MEEAPTIRLLNMHRIPATLRSYNIATIYVMQDKIQNDMMYGEIASRAILSNLSYQFFGKMRIAISPRGHHNHFETLNLDYSQISSPHLEMSSTMKFAGKRMGEQVSLLIHRWIIDSLGYVFSRRGQYLVPRDRATECLIQHLKVHLTQMG